MWWVWWVLIGLVVWSLVAVLLAAGYSLLTRRVPRLGATEWHDTPDPAANGVPDDRHDRDSLAS